MAKIFAWLKNNKLTVFLFLVVVYLLLKNRPVTFNSRQAGFSGSDLMLVSPAAEETSLLSRKGALYESAAPQPDITDRLVVEESNMSLVVDSVRQKTDQIIDYATSKGGYMVSSSVTQPEEVPFATVTVRVPAKELRPALDYLRGLAVKVTSENLTGYDVTDQYVDIESRLVTLAKTKAKFEEILAKAEKVEDILAVQRELISLQQQIDNLKGQQEYLAKTAENARLTVYLSTDEWMLPYTPDEKAFRPKVIFKTAVRSMVRALRLVAQLAIWVAVYSIIWLPVLIIWRVIKKKRNGK